MSKIVVLDPGHYEGYNKYPPFKGYCEGNQMWKLATKLKTRLEAKGVKVILTKSSLAANPGLQTRGSVAGKNKADLFISLHSNAVSTTVNNGVTGVECYYSIFDSNGQAFAADLCKTVCDVMATNNRGAKTRKGSGNWDYYGVIKGAVDSGCKHAFLIEHGFHTSTKDASFLIDDGKLNKLADAECALICKHLGIATVVTPKPATTTTKPSTTTKSFVVKVNDSALNIRAGAGTNYKIVGVIKDKGKYTIVETKGTVGKAGSWGKLKSGAGWISLNSIYVKVV